MESSEQPLSYEYPFPKVHDDTIEMSVAEEEAVEQQPEFSSFHM